MTKEYNKLKTPILRRMRETGGTIYTFPSVTEDIGLNLNERNNKVALTHYALLDIPKSDTVDRKNIDKNKFNPTLIPGHKLNYNNSIIGGGTVTPADHMVASLQNYVMNMENAIRNHPDYNYNLTETVSERIFWKWLKETGAIRWAYDEASDTFTEEHERKLNEDGSFIDSGYERVVKCVGEITATAKTEGSSGVYNETYINIPTSYGSPQQYFTVYEDNNYKLGKAYRANEFIEGRTDTDKFYTTNKSFTDYFTTLNKNDLPTTEYEDGEILSKHWTLAEGIEIPSSGSSSLFYVTDKNINKLVEQGFINSFDDLNIIMNYQNPGDSKGELKYKRSVLDGVSLIKNINDLKQVYEKRDEGIFKNYNTLSYDDINTSVENTESQFEFNAVLLYYSIFDNENNNVLATNLYGILFLENPVEITPANNTGFNTEFYLPAIQKVKSNRQQMGTGYSLKVSIKTTSVYDNTDAYIIDNTTSNALLGDSFNEILGNLKISTEKLLEGLKVNQHIANNYQNILMELSATDKKLISLNQKVNELLTNRLGHLEIDSIKVNNKLETNNIYSDEKFDIYFAENEEPSVTFTDAGIKTDKIHTIDAIHTNAYEYLNIKDDTDRDVMEVKTAQDILDDVIISELKIDQDEDLINDEEYKKQFVIDPKTFNDSNKTNELIKDLIKRADTEQGTDINMINYIKFIPIIIRFLQGIDPSYLISNATLNVTWQPKDYIISNSNTVYLDADGTMADMAENPDGNYGDKDSIVLERFSADIIATLSKIKVFGYFKPKGIETGDWNINEIFMYMDSKYIFETQEIVSGDDMEEIHVRDLQEHLKNISMEQNPNRPGWGIDDKIIKSTIMESGYSKKTETTLRPFITINHSPEPRIAILEVVAYYNVDEKGEDGEEQNRVMSQNAFITVYQKGNLKADKTTFRFKARDTEEQEVNITGEGLLDNKLNVRKIKLEDLNYGEVDTNIADPDQIKESEK